jgi:hypothetical protein
VTTTGASRHTTILATTANTNTTTNTGSIPIPNTNTNTNTNNTNTNTNTNQYQYQYQWPQQTHALMNVKPLDVLTCGLLEPDSPFLSKTPVLQGN